MTDRRLYELVTSDGRSISPFVWRSKYALASKGLAYETRALAFTDIPRLGNGRFSTVPILEDSGVYIEDSWAIADYLDQAYPDRKNLFGSAAERSIVRFFDEWMGSIVRPLLFRICVMDIYERLRAEDREYFRSSRESRLGRSLEAAAAGREALVPVLRDALAPLRLTLKTQPFVGGATPSYADFIGLGTFIWAGSVATLQLLADEDPLLGWVGRGLDLHDGIGRDLCLPGLGLQAT